MLKIGTKVKVYQKPQTDEAFEGFAKVITCVSADPEYPTYKVRFFDKDGTLESMTVLRIVFDRNETKVF